MKYQHSRKNFIAKLFGIGVSIGAVPALVASTLKRSTEPAVAAKTAPFRLRADTRSVARRDSNVV